MQIGEYKEMRQLSLGKIIRLITTLISRPMLGSNHDCDDQSNDFAQADLPHCLVLASVETRAVYVPMQHPFATHLPGIMLQHQMPCQ